MGRIVQGIMLITGNDCWAAIHAGIHANIDSTEQIRLRTKLKSAH